MHVVNFSSFSPATLIVLGQPFCCLRSFFCPHRVTVSLITRRFTPRIDISAAFYQRLVDRLISCLPSHSSCCRHSTPLLGDDGSTIQLPRLISLIPFPSVHCPSLACPFPSLCWSVAMSRHAAAFHEVETSPDGRYVRFDERLGTGAYKNVYLAYDTETGKEVAWNSIDMKRLPEGEKRRIRMETSILSRLNHPHIINFYHVWEKEGDEDMISFTTEIVTSGTLKHYTQRLKSVKVKVIKKWCRQILRALVYLHSHSPPIIHRDLKCDNIFIHGQQQHTQTHSSRASMRHEHRHGCSPHTLVAAAAAALLHLMCFRLYRRGSHRRLWFVRHSSRHSRRVRPGHPRVHGARAVRREVQRAGGRVRVRHVRNTLHAPCIVTQRRSSPRPHWSLTEHCCAVFACCAVSRSVLEMSSKEYPYQECSNAAQIWKRVSSGQKPEVLQRIRDHSLRAFIECCLNPESTRLTAAEMLEHPFLSFKRSDPFRDALVVAVDAKGGVVVAKGGAREAEEAEKLLKEVEREGRRREEEEEAKMRETIEETRSNSSSFNRPQPIDTNSELVDHISPLASPSSQLQILSPYNNSPSPAPSPHLKRRYFPTCSTAVPRSTTALPHQLTPPTAAVRAVYSSSTSIHLYPWQDCRQCSLQLFTSVRPHRLRSPAGRHCRRAGRGQLHSARGLHHTAHTLW